MTPKATPRDEAVRSVARSVLSLELDMEHVDAEQTFSVRDVRRALEEAYELGARRPALRSIAGGTSSVARADAAEAKVRELESRNAALLKQADERVRESTRLEVRVLELEAYVKQLEGY
jgi:hypothetical protein